jgi:cobalt-zinc-cadmium efflux system protein
MQGVPNGLDAFQLKRAVDSLPGVVFCYDLHVWSLTPGQDVLSLHVVAESGADSQKVMASVSSLLETKFHISHTTVQVETQAHYDKVECAKDKNCHSYADDV